MTLYIYSYDNSDREWRKLPAKIITVYELWDGIKPIDGCVENLPTAWSYTTLVYGPSPDPKIQ